MEKEKEREVVVEEELDEERSQLPCSLPQQCSTVVLVPKAIFFFPMNKEEDNKKSSMKRKRGKRRWRRRGTRSELQCSLQ